MSYTRCNPSFNPPRLGLMKGDKHMKLWVGMVLASIGLLCAQPPAPRGGGSPRVRGGMGDLGLTAEQQNKIYTARADAQVQTKGMREQARGLRDQLDAAIKGGDEGKI